MIFVGQKLKVEGGVSYPAVSGQPKATGEFDYSDERQKIPNVGPIPEGEYWIDPSQMWDNAWYRFNSPASAWGNHRITIRPYPHTKTHGRGGFFMHGGAVPGSVGCIDLTVGMDTFAHDLKQRLNGLPQCYIPLTVQYP